MQDLLNAIKNIWNKYKSQIILVLCLLVCIFFLIRSCENNLANKRIYDNNVKRQVAIKVNGKYLGRKT